MNQNIKWIRSKGAGKVKIVYDFPVFNNNVFQFLLCFIFLSLWL